MRGEVLGTGFGIFLICFLLHALWWRCHRPRLEASILLTIFGGLGSLLVLFLPVNINGPFTFEGAACWFMVMALGAAYSLLYPAAQAQSPSPRLIRFIRAAGSPGRSRAEIQSFFSTTNIFQSQMDDLLSSGLVARQGSHVILTSRGKAFLLPFIFFRKWLGLPPGRG